MQNQSVMNHIPESIMQKHDPNDDPFASLADDSTNQLTNPMEYGSGLSFFIEKKEEDKEEHTETGATEESTSSTDEDAAGAAKDDIGKPEKKGEPKDEVEGKKEE